MDWNKIKWRDEADFKHRLGDVKSPIVLRRGHADPECLFFIRLSHPVSRPYLQDTYSGE